MTHLMTILAQRRGRHDEANKWLDQHPMMLGSIALVFGPGLIAYGIYSLSQGVTRDKRGRKMTGGAAQAMSIIRLVAGVGCAGFGLYKMIAG